MYNYRDSVSRLQISYPSHWILKKNARRLVLFDPGNGCGTISFSRYRFVARHHRKYFNLVRLAIVFFFLLTYGSGLCQSMDTTINLAIRYPFYSGCTLINNDFKRGRFINPADGIRLQSHSRFDSVFAVTDGRVQKIEKMGNNRLFLIVQQNQDYTISYEASAENTFVTEKAIVKKGVPLFTMKNSKGNNEINIIVYYKKNKLPPKETLVFLQSQ